MPRIKRTFEENKLVYNYYHEVMCGLLNCVLFVYQKTCFHEETWLSITVQLSTPVMDDTDIQV